MGKLGAAGLLVGIVSLGTACGGEDATTGATNKSGSGGAGTTSQSSGSSGTQSSGQGGQDSTGWETLIDLGWDMASGKEGYRCTRKTIAEDTYVNGFRAMSPPGTHHTIVAKLGDGAGPDGEYPCDSSELGHSMMFTTGVGTGDLAFPDGVAVFIPGGSQILLNLHLFNTTGETLTGTSGALVKTIEAGSMEHEAEIILAGTMQILVLPQSKATFQGTCKFAADATILSVWPHMHQLGTHMKVTHNGEVLHDAPYQFSEQVGYDIAPRPVKKGEGITVACSYDNTTSQSVYFGESSENEMCFAGLYRYPATGTQSICADD